MITQAQANEYFRRGNDMGCGYAPGSATTVDEAIDELGSDGWEVLFRGATSSDVTVLRNADNETIAIGDVNGPWAVVVSDLLPTVEPVTASGWYELVDGSVARIMWRAGTRKTVRIVQGWEAVSQ